MAVFKNYTQAVNDGDIFFWLPESIATSDRFNKNTKYAIDNMVNLRDAINVDISLSNSKIGENLSLINGLVLEVESNLSLIGTKVAQVDYAARVAAVDAQMLAIGNLIADLDATYATDTDIAAKVATINAAWLSADSSLQTALNTLIADRYTKAQTDAAMALKAPLSDTYTRATLESKLSTKFENTGGVIRGDIIPDIADTYTLGSAAKPFKDIFVGAHSLYVDGVQAFSSNLGTIVMSADVDQNVQLKTTGSGDIEFFPSGNGAIQMKGSVQIPSNKFIMTNDGTDVHFAAGIIINGNLTGMDNIYTKTETVAQVDTGLASVRGAAPASYDTLGKIAAKIAILDAMLFSGDVNMDTIQEIVTAVTTNKGLFDSLAASKVSKTSIVNNLTTSDATGVLSAFQGVTIKAALDALSSKVSSNDVLLDTTQKVVDYIKALKAEIDNPTYAVIRVGASVVVSK